MRHRAWALLMGSMCAGIAHGQSGVVVTAPAGSIQLDGRLDESAWRQTAPILLTQQSPRPGADTPFGTEVRALISGNTLYLGFECMDPEPQRIAIHSMQRDGDFAGDDSVAVVLDTYGDRRTGYYFRVNASGARADGIIAGVEEPSLEWDGLWNAVTARTSTGWSAEIEIPVNAINFTRGLAQWGANFERYVARERTALRWTSPTLDSFLYDLSRGGELSGVEDLRQGRGILFSPFSVGRMLNNFPAHTRALLGQPGADVTWRITPQLASVFTVNTDFAETEVDTRQLNVTRFPLLFPERRTFFLEGSNQFQFGLGLEELFIPFFSRRVGLLEGEQIPINGGVKLNGRIGRMNVGVLDVQTRDKYVTSLDSLVPGTNLFAGRLSYDVTSKFRVGMLLTNGSPDGIRRNTWTGFDAVWRTSEFMRNKNFLIGGWTAFSSGDVPAGNRTGWGFKVDYPNDRWDCFASLNQFGEAMEAALGFLPRPGTRRFETACEFKPRPRKDGPFGWIRQEFMEQRFYRVTNYRGELESQRFWWAPVNVLLESGDRFEVNWVPWFEFLPAPFEIADGVILPIGKYRFDRFRAEFETSRHRRWEFGTTTWFGTFYNGRLLQQTNYLRFTDRRGRWQAGLGSEQNFGTLAQGKFIQRLLQTNVTYAFTPNVVWTTFLQYDTESQNVGNNMRLRWIIRPGNELFIVWNRGWKRILLSRDDLNLIPERELLAVKLRWTFRK